MKKTAKKTTTFILIAIAAALVGIAVCAAVFYLIPESKYKNAVSLYEAGKYKDAAAIFEELGNYSDSEHKLAESRYDYAVELFKEKSMIKRLLSLKVQAIIWIRIK